jgi:hypothetical protein
LSKKLGGDPELFLVNRQSGKIVSAHRFIPEGYKTEYDNYCCEDCTPTNVEGLRRDGAAIEIGFIPVWCREDLVSDIAYQLKQALLLARANNFNNTKLVGKPVAELSKASLKGAPEDIMIFGCDPDYSAYVEGPKSPTLRAGDLRRYTGGHLHFNYGGDEYTASYEEYNCSNKSKAERIEHGAAAAVVFDYVIGLPAVAVLGEVHGDGEAQRRHFYGQAGSYRTPEHGVEYRVLSGNGAMLHPVLLSLWMGMGREYSNKGPKSLKNTIAKFKEHIPVETVRQIIDTHDYKTAWELILDGLWAKTMTVSSYPPRRTEMGMVQVLARASKDGVSWSDDIGFNWQARTQDNRSYVTGTETAFGGWASEVVFPQRQFLSLDKRKKEPNVLHCSEEATRASRDRVW